MRSRGIPFGELDDLIRSVWRHFRRHPGRFFFPPGQEAGV
jgi:site-specific recombinase